MNILLGFDPGGAGAFGWCVAEHSAQLPIRIRRTGIANDAQGAVDAALSFVVNGADTVLAAAIDAPLFWVASGDRRADQLVRDRVRQSGGQSSSVQHVNSLQGACLIQGILAGLLLRTIHPELRLTESHPKAFLWIAGIANDGLPAVMVTLQHLAQLIESDEAGSCDHERDAAIATLSAWAMVVGLAGAWTDLYPLEEHPYSPLAQPLAYWMPTPANSV